MAFQTDLMPALFIGHGSPMNALAQNRYSQTLQKLGEDLPRPKMILCISAHWLTRGCLITHMASPRTIHDFSGFPKELFDIQYPAPGAPAWAEKIMQNVSEPVVRANDDWGLDHGTWSVLKHIYPKADIPVLQLSIDYHQPPQYHFQVGQALQFLRKEGVLILGSGNIVHNLRKILWQPDVPSYPWAIEFDAWVKEKLMARDFKALVEDPLKSEAGRESIPTPDHWYPMLYVLGAADMKPHSDVQFVYEGLENGSISMQSFMF